MDVHNFKNINIPNKITKILLNTFYNVTIPESVKEITYEAFWGWSSLKDISILEKF